MPRFLQRLQLRWNRHRRNISRKHLSRLITLPPRANLNHLNTAVIRRANTVLWEGLRIHPTIHLSWAEAALRSPHQVLLTMYTTTLLHLSHHQLEL